MPDLARVTPDELPLLQAMSIYQAPIGQALLSELLLKTCLKTADGGAYNPATVKQLLASLSAQKLLRAETGKGSHLTDGVAIPVLHEIHAQGGLRAWVRTVRELLQQRHEYRSWQALMPEFCKREMLFSAFVGLEDEMLGWREKFYGTGDGERTPPGANLFDSRQGIEIFAGLRSPIQSILLHDIFFHARWHLDDCRAAWDYALQFIAAEPAQSIMLYSELCWQALLRGDFPALAQLQRTDPSLHIDFERVMAIVSGDFPLAVELIEEHIKLVRGQTGKRKLYFPGLSGLLQTTALLAANTPASLKRAQEQIGEGVKYNQSRTYPLLQPLITHLQQGLPLSTPAINFTLQSNVDALFCALALLWLEAPPNSALHQHLLGMRSSMRERGYLWLAAEIDTLLHQQYGDAAELPGWHGQHHIKPLVAALQREAAWQRALTALAQLKPASSGNQYSSDVRIAWLLDLGRHGIRLSPLEQKRSAKGLWSKGRAVALKRMAHEQDSLPGLSEQDKRLATCIHKSYDPYYGGAEYDLNGEKALPHLIGHPAVYWYDAPDVRIDVDKGEAALLLKQQGEQIQLLLEPPVGTGEHVVWRKTTPTRLAVYAVSAEIRQIAGILGHGLAVPANAKAQLVQVIAAIAPHLAIHSDLPELASHIAAIPADTTLYAHLLPLQAGLRLQLLMRPLTDGGWYAPGKGSANVLGEQAGKAVQASRDLAAEKARLQQVLLACPALQAAQQDQDGGSVQEQEWQLAEPQDCLELLSELKALPADTLQLVWPEGERFRLAGNRSLAQMKLGIKQQGEWFVASGSITLDDGRVLALRELLQLATQSNGRFLKLGEHDYLALTESFRKRLAELNAFGEASGKDGVRISLLAAPALAELAGEVGELKADSAWREQVKKLDGLGAYAPLLPSTLQAELREYQFDGYRWLARLAHWGVGACLADDMGLGKTVQTLALLLLRATGGPQLVVAPISVAMNWQAEVARFAPTLRVRAYHRERSLDNLAPFDLVITSYGLLQSDAESFAAQYWHSVVLDEAQVIKNAATKRSQAAMALQAGFKMIASGTPVENHLGELWNLFRFINPGLLGSKERFAERFANPIERGDKAARAHLKKLIQPFILRRTKTQVLSELPSRTEITLQVTLSDEERHLYEALRQEAVDKIAHLQAGEGNPALQVLAEITKLRRFCCNPKLVLKNSTLAASKLAVFADTVQELLDNRHKALVFSQFVDHLSIVREWLDQAGIHYQYLDGSTPPLERKKRVDAFQAGDGDIFLISLKAGGTGLNLTAADYVIHLDPWWNPAVEDQASDRAHRMGQLRPVTIYRLVTEATIEEKIIALHAEKRDLADSLLDGGDVAGKLDTAALLKLLQQSA